MAEKNTRGRSGGSVDVTGPDVEKNGLPNVGCGVAYAAHVAARAEAGSTFYVREAGVVVAHAERLEDRSVVVRSRR